MAHQQATTRHPPPGPPLENSQSYGFTTARSAALIYDSDIHANIEQIAKRATAAVGAPNTENEKKWIKDYLEKSPRRPVMYHFGERDPYIPPSDVEKIRAADPHGVFHLYPADHGFNCDERSAYDAASAALARERSLEFLAANLSPTRSSANP